MEPCDRKPTKRVMITEDSSSSTLYAALGILRSPEKKKFMQKIYDLQKYKNVETKDATAAAAEDERSKLKAGERTKVLNCWQFKRDSGEPVYEDLDMLWDGISKPKNI